MFTITGGLTAVMFTDTIETVIMVIGGVVLGALALDKVGGYSEMVRQFATAYPSPPPTIDPLRNITNCNDSIPSNFMHFMRPVTDGDLPWTGITLGLTISATWYWCTDQGKMKFLRIRLQTLNYRRRYYYHITVMKGS